MSGTNHTLPCWHPVLGDCEVVRKEGVNWIVRQSETGREFRVSPSKRHEFSRRRPAEAPTTPIVPASAAKESEHQVAPESKAPPTATTMTPGGEVKSKEKGDTKARQSSTQDDSCRNRGWATLVISLEIQQYRDASDTEKDAAFDAVGLATWKAIERWLAKKKCLDEDALVVCRRLILLKSVDSPLSPGDRSLGKRLLDQVLASGLGQEVNNGDVPQNASSDGTEHVSLNTVKARFWVHLREWAQSTNNLNKREQGTCTWLAVIRRTGTLSEDECQAGARVLKKAMLLGYKQGVQDGQYAKSSSAADADSDQNKPSRKLDQTPNSQSVVRTERQTLEPGTQSTKDDAALESAADHARSDTGANRDIIRPGIATSRQTERTAPTWVSTSAASEHKLVDLDTRRLRRVFHSLRMGLPPVDTAARQLAVDTEEIEQSIGVFLETVAEHGGDAIDLQGVYGQGKSFTLRLLEEIAVESGFLVVKTEVDAGEYRLDKPFHVYRGLLQSLRMPGEREQGVRKFAEYAAHALEHVADGVRSPYEQAEKRRNWLRDRIECKRISWLFSDPDFLNKPKLMGALAGAPIGPLSNARQSHVLRGKVYDWPTFMYGTQGDVACCLLAGLARLARLLHFRGLIVILDEMEKWQDLNWSSQARGGNLLGGLIWSATAATGQRWCRCQEAEGGYSCGGNGCDHPESLRHSHWGGCPFSTRDRCHIGLALAMTPRGDSGPEEEWQEYGRLRIINLPEFKPSSLDHFFRRIAPHYQRAYELPSCVPDTVFSDAMQRWRSQGSFSPRSGITAVLDAMDEWRDRNGFSS